MLAKPPVQAGGQPFAEVAPPVMGEDRVKERHVVASGPIHSATKLFMNPNFVLESVNIVANKKDIIPALEKLNI